MNRDDIEILDKQTVYQGYFQIDRYRLRHRLFAGGWSAEVVREVFERGHAVAVLLYDPDRDAVVLVEQFRPGAMAAGFEPWLLEAPAGIVKPGEALDDVARREVEEECGTRVTELVPIYHYLVSPGGASESVALYCARIDSTTAGGIHGLSDEHEDIKVSALPFAEAFAGLASGRIVNAMTILALQWLALNRDDLRQRWR